MIVTVCRSSSSVVFEIKFEGMLPPASVTVAVHRVSPVLVGTISGSHVTDSMLATSDTVIMIIVLASPSSDSTVML